LKFLKKRSPQHCSYSVKTKQYGNSSFSHIKIHQNITKAKELKIPEIAILYFDYDIMQILASALLQIDQRFLIFTLELGHCSTPQHQTKSPISTKNEVSILYC
jgi:hypothetical protein